jgi:hypothetical protein
MIISHGRRYVFVHIPKTGGTSMARALEARAMADDVLIGDTPKARRRKGRLQGLPATGRVWKHSTVADMIDVIGPEGMRAYLVFTLVRNPWDRMVSYYHWLRLQSFDHPAVGWAKAHDFGTFLARDEIADSLRQSPYASYVSPAPHPVFIRLEHLEQDLQPVEAHLGFALDMPHDNPSERGGDYRPYYTDASRAVVASICAADIARFGYRFE